MSDNLINAIVDAIMAATPTENYMRTVEAVNKLIEIHEREKIK
jgi:hypothetical protein